jgi:hypothetical protein
MKRVYSLPGLAMLAVASVAAGKDVSAAHGHGRHAPPVGHVFVIVLENESYDVTFGPKSPAPYLATTLPAQGVLLTQYFGTGHYSLDNYLAMLSGQAANPDTRDDCETYSEFVATGTTPDGQAIGRGCVYPAGVKTLADELDAVGRHWRGYFEDMGNDPAREAPACGHPALGAKDPTQKAERPSAGVPTGDAYAVRHNPFVYFHSVIDSPECAQNVVALTALARDLGAVATTPDFSFIVPSLCSDGHDAPCVDGRPGGLRSADAFLREWVPRILASPAYRRDGLLVITFDEGDAEVAKDAAGGVRVNFPGATCCNQQPGPNLAPFPQTETWENETITFQSFGGDRTGTVLLSPWLVPGTRSATPFNHYALLRTIEGLLGTGGHLGYAGQPGLVGFFDRPGSDVRFARHRAAAASAGDGGGR